MSDQETRVTRVSRLAERLGAGAESCLVSIHGHELGRRYVLGEADFTIGRDAENDVEVDLDNVSRRHAKITTRDGTAFLVDLDSTNGTYLNGEEVRGETPLRSGDLLQVGGAYFKFLSGGNIEAKYHEEIYQLTIADGLTQVSNKRHFLDYLEREMGRSHRYGRALSLVLFDIDHFKQINDTHGHLAGDHVLRELAALVKPRIRREECFARYGGEEFAIAIPEAGAENVRRFAEKLRKLIQEHAFSYEGKDIPVTVSMGVADMSGDMTEPGHFIRVADTHLYEAKNAGRNQVRG